MEYEEIGVPDEFIEDKELMMMIHYQELTDIRSRGAEIMRILCPDKRDDEDYEEILEPNPSPYKILVSARNTYYEAKRQGHCNLQKRFAKSKLTTSFN